MPTVTSIRFDKGKDRYFIDIDGKYCASIRSRTFPAMGIEIGRQISCEELVTLEKFHWKNVYGETAWEQEKFRIKRVEKIITHVLPQIKLNIVGFGADSNRRIEQHPDVSGSPDVEVFGVTSGHKYCDLEVTGTKRKRGNTFWIRPDKIKFAQDNPNRNVWICLHYEEPMEELVFIKPQREKLYAVIEQNIRGSIEHFVEFSYRSPEYFDLDGFKAHLLSLRDEVFSKSSDNK